MGGGATHCPHRSSRPLVPGRGATLGGVADIGEEGGAAPRRSAIMDSVARMTRGRRAGGAPAPAAPAPLSADQRIRALEQRVSALEGALARLERKD